LYLNFLFPSTILCLQYRYSYPYLVARRYAPFPTEVNSHCLNYPRVLYCTGLLKSTAKSRSTHRTRHTDRQHRLACLIWVALRNAVVLKAENHTPNKGRRKRKRQEKRRHTKKDDRCKTGNQGKLDVHARQCDCDCDCYRRSIEKIMERRTTGIIDSKEGREEKKEKTANKWNRDRRNK